MSSIFKIIKDWWTYRHLAKAFDKEVDENTDLWFNRSIPELLHEERLEKYHQGLLYVKEEIKKKANGDFHSYLTSVGDKVLELARHETPEQEADRKLKESIYIYNGQDVKTSEDTKKMVDKRIEHYYKLQRTTEARAKLRECRKAFKEGNLELHAKLKKEIEDTYGRL